MRSLLDKGSKDVQGRRCILLWRMFLEFERVRPVPAAEADVRVKVIFYRAIQNCKLRCAACGVRWAVRCAVQCVVEVCGVWCGVQCLVCGVRCAVVVVVVVLCCVWWKCAVCGGGGGGVLRW